MNEKAREQQMNTKKKGEKIKQNKIQENPIK